MYLWIWNFAMAYDRVCSVNDMVLVVMIQSWWKLYRPGGNDMVLVVMS